MSATRGVIVEGGQLVALQDCSVEDQVRCIVTRRWVQTAQENVKPSRGMDAEEIARALAAEDILVPPLEAIRAAMVVVVTESETKNVDGGLYEWEASGEPRILRRLRSRIPGRTPPAMPNIQNLGRRYR